MKIVIQCAASKSDHAGCLATSDGKSIIFVAYPEYAPYKDGYFYCRPDDLSPDGITWRNKLIDYNNKENNPDNLLPAYQLYRHESYVNLVDRYGKDNIYILSAGWGLISSQFLTPVYDITFSISAEKYKRRKNMDKYDDFCQLKLDCHEDLLFFGGKDYLPLFSILTRSYQGRRIIFYNSKIKPNVSGCSLVRYTTTTRTNWHYECVKAFINKKVSIRSEQYE